MLIPPGSRLVFIGDSITDCGRAHPAVQAKIEAFGNGYVSLVEVIITASDPTKRLQIVNVGVSGDTVRDIANRWKRDVLAWEPEWLSIMIGINDVWRSFDPISGFVPQVSLEEYSRTLRELVGSIRSRLQGLILMSPYHLQPDRSDPMRTMMDRFGAAMREIAEESRAIFIDTQAAFDRAMNNLNPMSLAEDRIHVNLVGHAILARAFLDGVEFKWQL